MQDNNQELLNKINNKQTVMLSLLSKEEIEDQIEKAQADVFQNVEIEQKSLENYEKKLDNDIESLLKKLEKELENE